MALMDDGVGNRDRENLTRAVETARDLDEKVGAIVPRLRVWTRPRPELDKLHERVYPRSQFYQIIFRVQLKIE